MSPIYAQFPMSRLFVLLILLNIGIVVNFVIFVESNRNAKQFVAASSVFSFLFCVFYVAVENLSTFQNMEPTVVLFLNFLFVFGLTKLWLADKPQRHV